MTESVAGPVFASTVFASTVAVLGLGEAGSLISRDLVAAGAAVRGYDPVAPAPDGVAAATSEADACTGASLVISLTTAHESQAAFRAAAPGVAPGALYADLNTASPGLKQRLAADAAAAGVQFADVAIMSIVPGHGIRAPMLVSGPAAEAVAAALNRLGGAAQVLPGPPGTAATRKLVRSVFYKGLAAAVTEALRAGRAAGCEDWLRGNITEELTAAGPGTVDRMEQGSITHAVRRADEMAAAAELLDDLNIPSRITTATLAWLTQLAAEAATPTPPGTLTPPAAPPPLGAP
jgi:3-hydroxyisobutyrate dehydrogenase-like beta-hydroxyacid dehydrogenase